MNEKQRKRGFRYSGAALLVSIALLAVLSRLWNPFEQRRPIIDFLELKLGTPRDVVVDQFGPPAREWENRIGLVLMYQSDVGKVWLSFEDEKYVGLSADRVFPARPRGI